MGNKAVPAWVGITVLALSVVAFFVNGWATIRSMGEILPSVFIGSVILEASILVALFYALEGYKKDATGYYLIFCWLLLLVKGLFCYASARMMGDGFVNSIPFIFKLIGVSLMSVLTMAKDLGKKKSFILTGIILELLIIESIIRAFTIPMTLIGVLTELCVTAMFALMVYAKYKDKDARGTT